MDIINIGIFTNDMDYGIALGNKLSRFNPEYLIYIRSREELESDTKIQEMDLVLIDGWFENAQKTILNWWKREAV